MCQKTNSQSAVSVTECAVVSALLLTGQTLRRKGVPAVILLSLLHQNLSVTFIRLMSRTYLPRCTQSLAEISQVK